MYKAISYFKDMKDNMHSYNPGDKFPRDGLEVSEERIAELASDKNRRGKAVIELVEEKKVYKKPELLKEIPKDDPEPKAETESEKPKPKTTKRGRKKNAD